MTNRAQWKKGQSGNPHGANSKKLMRDALSLALTEKHNGVKKLRLVAQALVDKAMDGDVSAIKEVYERMDGKVPNVNVEVPVKALDEMTHDELVSAILGSQDDRGTEADSDLSRAKPAGNA